MTINSIDDLQSALREQLYIADRGLATAIYLALKLGRPLFLEGEAGVGKTEVAKVITRLLDADLIRLQCYEGLDVHHAVYEWNYTRQMMHIRLMEARGVNGKARRRAIRLAVASSQAPISRPGIAPARNSLPMETSVTSA